MKNQIVALLVAVGFTLASADKSHAMSSLVSMSAEAVWPTSSTPDGNLVYTITTVGRAGAGLLEVVLTAGDLPAGVSVTFTPSVLRFTGNQATLKIATMTVSCQGLIPLDCFPFTITGTSQRETMTITNFVYFTPQFLAVRPPTLILDKLTSGGFWIRGAGATGKTYQIQASPSVANPVWTPIGSSTADANGRFTFFTSQAINAAVTANMPMRFYRAVTTSGPFVP